MSFDSGEYRLLVESSYERDQYPRDGYGPASGYQSAPGYPAAEHPSGYGYQQSATDDFGYGDPGYADPSYDGPRDQGGYPAGPVPGRQSSLPAPSVPAGPPPALPAPVYQLPQRPGSAMEEDHIYPVTGAQEIYREPDGSGYPAAYYDEQPLAGLEPADQGPAGQRLPDPRLAGLRYDELHYDDGEFDGDPRYDESRYDESRYDEPLDDEAWYEELRRSGPAFPQQPARPGVPPDPGRPAGPVPVGGYAAPSGYGNSGYDAPARQDRPAGYPAGNGSAPRMSMVPGTGQAPGPVMGLARTPGIPGSPVAPGPAAGFQPAPMFGPAAPVGVLTPPAGSQFAARLSGPQTRPAPAMTAPAMTAPAMSGPDTVAWDAAAGLDDVDSLEEYWQEDQEDDRYLSVLEESDAGPGTGTQAAAGRGRRRGRSNDHRLWLGLGGVVVVAAAAIFGIMKFEFPSNSGPAHQLVTPAKIASYQWAPNLEKKSSLNSLRQRFIQMSGGAATSVVSREYESGATSGSGSNQAQIVMFIGGHVANDSPSGSVTAFTQDYKGARVVSAGPGGGEAACFEQVAGSDSVAMCAWFDNDTVGAVVSPTMNTTQLASVMRTFRPVVELVRR